jgi:hypothetical protein
MLLLKFGITYVRNTVTGSGNVRIKGRVGLCDSHKVLRDFVTVIVLGDAPAGGPSTFYRGSNCSSGTSKCSHFVLWAISFCTRNKQRVDWCAEKFNENDTEVLALIHTVQRKVKEKQNKTNTYISQKTLI